MFLRILLPIALLSVTHTSTYAEARLKMKTWSFDSHAKAGGTSWLPKNSNSSESSGSIYFYAAPGYDGSSWAGVFIPLQAGKHHVWFNTGSLLWSSGFGYRYVLDSSYLNQKWVCGTYFGREVHGSYKKNSELYSLCKQNVGVEIVGSRFGQLTTHIHWDEYLVSDTLRTVETYDFLEKKYEDNNIIDNSGVSAKWVSVPSAWGVQGSIAVALTNVCSKMQEGDQSFTKENVFHLGVGCEFNVSSWAHIELRWTLIDKYKPFKFGPSFGVKFIGVKPHLAKDIFQGRLKRLPQYHTPLYANVSLARDFFREVDAATARREASVDNVTNARSNSPERGAYVPDLREDGVARNVEEHDAPPVYSKLVPEDHRVLAGAIFGI